MNPPQRPGPLPEVLPPRPQVGIERLPARHPTTEPRESMNCKSCRKRKIKCNRVRPSCDACKVFQCDCIYDAVPKKRGPKTDVLEALLKRVDGLEAKLKEKNSELEQVTQSASTSKLPAPAPAPPPPLPLPPPPALASAPLPAPAPASAHASIGTFADAPSVDFKVRYDARIKEPDVEEPAAKRIALEERASPGVRELSVYSPRTPASGEPAFLTSISSDILLDAFFTHLHCRPYHIVDEASIRNRAHLNQLPTYLFDAIAALAVKRTSLQGGHQAAAKLSREYASRARNLVDTDEPSIDALQTLLLLVLAFVSDGKGKKSFMLLNVAVGMAMALELHREIDPHIRVTASERELRRRIFWTCYLLDRFASSGSRRPSIINDATIFLRLPSWAPTPSSLPLDGEVFLCGSNLQYFSGAGKQCQGATGALIDITRILGVTHRYLAAGGVKGDSHFPWHSLSNLSKIRQDLDVWASGTGNMFSSVNATLGQTDSAVLTLAKLIYHCIHCLIYRPFLPIHLVELAGNGHQQSWQIEATNMCFFHANAIAELVAAAKAIGTVELAPFTGYSICAAGTVHIHGAFYGKQKGSSEMSMFDSSADFLAREMQMLSDLLYTWGIMQNQREMLQRLYEAHGELVSRTMSGSMMRYTPGFQLEDFFDRYSEIGGPGGLSFHFDSANLSLLSLMTDYSNNDAMSTGELQIPTPRSEQAARSTLKRKNTSQSPHQQLLEMKPHGGNHAPPLPTALANPAYFPPRSAVPMPTSMMQHPPPPPPPHSSSPSMQGAPIESAHVAHHHLSMRTPDITPPGNGTMAHYGMGNSPHSTPGGMGSMGSASFGPTYSYHTVTTPNGAGPAVFNDASGGYDAMFGGLPSNAYGSPAAWAGDGYRLMGQTTPGGAAPSPSTKSNCGSTGTGGDEKDPFMSLLEQLANDEQRQHNGLKNELDFYLTGPHGRP